MLSPTVIQRHQPCRIGAKVRPIQDHKPASEITPCSTPGDAGERLSYNQRLASFDSSPLDGQIRLVREDKAVREFDVAPVWAKLLPRPGYTKLPLVHRDTQ